MAKRPIGIACSDNDIDNVLENPLYRSVFTSEMQDDDKTHVVRVPNGFFVFEDNAQAKKMYNIALTIVLSESIFLYS